MKKKVILMLTTALIFSECFPVSAKRFPHGAGQCRGYENLAREYRKSASGTEVVGTFYSMVPLSAAKPIGDLMNSSAKRDEESAKRADQKARECWEEVNKNDNRGGSGNPTPVPSIAPTGGFGNDL